MTIVDWFSGGRGAAMRKEFERVRSLLDRATPMNLRACNQSILHWLFRFTDECVSTHPADQIAFLKELRLELDTMWEPSLWPRACGLAVVILNAESRLFEGKDVHFVGRVTDRMIDNAMALYEDHKPRPISPMQESPGVVLQFGTTQDIRGPSALTQH